MDEFIIIILFALILCVLGPIAFFMTLFQGGKVRRLTDQVDGLERALYSLRAQVFDASNGAAQGVSPAVPEETSGVVPDPDPDPAAEPEVTPDRAMEVSPPNAIRLPEDDEPLVDRPEVLPAAAAAAVGAQSPSATPESTGLDSPALQTKPARRGIEQALAANWMVWVGGLAIAMGGLFLVRVAMDAGLFGPMARVVMAAVMGGVLIAAGLHALRWPLVRDGDGMVGRLPEVISAAGTTTLYGATVGAGLLYGFVPPLVALGLFVAVSAVAVVLSLKFGLLLAALGFAGAFVGPLLTGSPGGDVLPLLPYFGAITLAGMYLVKLREWRFLTWLVLIGAGVWGVIATGSGEYARHWAVPAYALVIGAGGLMLGEKSARVKRKTLFINPFADAESESVFAAYGFWILAGALILLTGLGASSLGQASLVVTAALAVYGGIGLLMTWQRHGYALIAPLSALASLLALILWPSHVIDMSVTPIAFAIGFGLLGTVLMMRDREQNAPLAFVAALTPPVMLFVAFWRGGLEPGFAWGLGAAALALCLGAVLEWIGRQDGGHDARPGQTIAFAVGAGLSATLAPFLVLHGIWLAPSLTVVSAMLALVWRRFPYEPLRLASLGALAGSVFLMMRPGLLRNVSLSEMPIVNEITGLFAVAIGAALAARWVMREVPHFARAFEGAAWILGFGWIGLTIRHIAGGGDLYDGQLGVGEASAYAISYLGAATSLAWRMRAPGAWMRAIETLALLLGVGGLLLVLGATLGSNESYFDMSLLAIPAWLMPTFLVAALAVGWRRRGYTIMPPLATCAAMALGFAWVNVETICVFEMLNFGDDGMWIFSASWIIYAFVLLAIAIWRGSGVVRFGSLAVLIVSILKVFLFDLANLDGLARAGSFIGLGVALIAAALFYQRFVFRKSPAGDEPEPAI